MLQVNLHKGPQVLSHSWLDWTAACGEAGAVGVCVEPGPAAWVVIGVGGPIIEAGIVFVVPGWVVAP